MAKVTPDPAEVIARATKWLHADGGFRERARGLVTDLVTALAAADAHAQEQAREIALAHVTLAEYGHSLEQLTLREAIKVMAEDYIRQRVERDALVRTLQAERDELRAALAAKPPVTFVADAQVNRELADLQAEITAANSRIESLCQAHEEAYFRAEAAESTQARLREALIKVRAHTGYMNPTVDLLAGLLQSIERITDAALTPAADQP